MLQAITSEQLGVKTVPAPLRKGYVPALDGLRGLSIICVVLWHYIWPPFIIGQTYVDDWPYKIGGLVKPLYTGIDMFFVLSGFLIGGILLGISRRKREHGKAPGKPEGQTMRHFYIRRVFRILPIYLCLVLAVVILRQIPDMPLSYTLGPPELEIWPYLTFFQNYIEFQMPYAEPGALAPSWSLAVEEQFYLFFPLAIFLVRWRVSGICAIAILAIIVSFIGRLYAPEIMGPYNPETMEGFTPYKGYKYSHFRMEGLAGGVLLAAYIRSAFYKTHIRATNWMMALFGIGCFISVFTHLDGMYVGQPRIHLEATIVSLALVYACWAGAKWTGFIATPILIWFGKISYCLYLAHQLVGGLTFWAIFGLDPPRFSEPRHFLWVPVALAVALIISVVFHKYVEEPLRNYGRRIN